MGQLFSADVKVTVRNKNLTSRLLFKAVTSGDTNNVKKLLVDKDLINTKQKDGSTLLHCAVKHSQINCVKFLLASGVSVDARDSDGNTPLILAAEAKDGSCHECVKALLDAKSDINATNKWNKTALLQCLIQFRNKIAELLLHLGADPNISANDGILPLHVCACYKNRHLLKRVLDAKGDINGQDQKGRTALYFAVLSGHVEIVQDLIGYGCSINLGSNYGTPLQTAVVKSNYKAVQTLILSGAYADCEVNEVRPMLSSATDIFSLGTLVCEVQANKIGDMSSQLSDSFTASVKVLECLFDARGCHNETRFLLPIARRLSSLGHQNTEAYMIFMRLLQKQVVLSQASPASNSLQNVCRKYIRGLLMNSRCNVIWAAEKLDIPKVLKEMLLMKDV